MGWNCGNDFWTCRNSFCCLGFAFSLERSKYKLLILTKLSNFMSGITKTAFWLTLIAGIITVLDGIGSAVSKTIIEFGPSLRREIKIQGAIIAGVVLVVASILMRKTASRKVGAIIALILGLLLSVFMSVGSEYITLLPLISGILVLTHKEQ